MSYQATQQQQQQGVKDFLKQNKDAAKHAVTLSAKRQLAQKRLEHERRALIFGATNADFHNFLPSGSGTNNNATVNSKAQRGKAPEQQADSTITDSTDTRFTCPTCFGVGKISFSGGEEQNYENPLKPSNDKGTQTKLIADRAFLRQCIADCKMREPIAKSKMSSDCIYQRSLPHERLNGKARLKTAAVRKPAQSFARTSNHLLKKIAKTPDFKIQANAANQQSMDTQAQNDVPCDTRATKATAADNGERLKDNSSSKIIEAAGEQTADIVDPNCPVGFCVMPEQRRQVHLTYAHNRFKQLANELSNLPIASGAMSVKLRKALLAQKLLKLDDDIRNYSKPIVYIEESKFDCLSLSTSSSLDMRANDF